MWFNTENAPVSAKAVRQAVAYSLDRIAILTQLSAPVATGAQPLQALVTPAYGPFDTQPFAKYRADLTTATQLLLGAGWTKGRDGVWVKGGQKIAIELKVLNTSAREQQEATLIATQLRAAGFLVTVVPAAPAALFTHDLPTGGFTAALYPVDLRRHPAGAVSSQAGIVDNDPGQCWLFCSTSIPTTANGAVGANYVRVADATLDRYLVDLDANRTDSSRLADAAAAANILADLVPAIPVAEVPDIVVVNTGKLGVEGGTFSHNLAYGPYVYLNEWYLR